jgi:hypothetical protein
MGVDLGFGREDGEIVSLHVEAEVTCDTCGSKPDGKVEPLAAKWHLLLELLPFMSCSLIASHHTGMFLLHI